MTNAARLAASELHRGTRTRDGSTASLSRTFYPAPIPPVPDARGRSNVRLVFVSPRSVLSFAMSRPMGSSRGRRYASSQSLGKSECSWIRRNGHAAQAALPLTRGQRTGATTGTYRRAARPWSTTLPRPFASGLRSRSRWPLCRRPCCAAWHRPSQVNYLAVFFTHACKPMPMPMPIPPKTWGRFRVAVVVGGCPRYHSTVPFSPRFNLPSPPPAELQNSLARPFDPSLALPLLLLLLLLPDLVCLLVPCAFPSPRPPSRTSTPLHQPLAEPAADGTHTAAFGIWPSPPGSAPPGPTPILGPKRPRHQDILDIIRAARPALTSVSIQHSSRFRLPHLTFAFPQSSLLFNTCSGSFTT